MLSYQQHPVRSKEGDSHSAKSKFVPIKSPSQSLLIQRRCACGGTCSKCQGKTAQHHDDDETVQPKRTSNKKPDHDELYDNVHNVIDSPGQPLENNVRSFLEPKFGFDFSNVRVHTDSKAAQSANFIDASAYTVGNNIVFAHGNYNPDTIAGKQLLAHELTHVVQQNTSPRSHGKGIHLDQPDNPQERQAEEVSQKLFHSSNESHYALHSINNRSTNTIQRQRSPGARNSTPARRQTTGVSPIVEDDQPAVRGQLHKTEFLFALRERLIRESNATLSSVGRTAQNCPYIIRTIEYYLNRPVNALLRLIHHYAHPPRITNAQGLMDAVSARTAGVVTRLAASGPRVQRKSHDDDTSVIRHDPTEVIGKLGYGHTLEDPTRTQMEQSFGTSFSDVRIHIDGAASNLSAEMNARAFAVGNNVAFGYNEYKPGTLKGDALIAHELAHTIQQKEGANKQNSKSNKELEGLADQSAMMAIAGAHPSAMGESPLSIQRDGVGEVALVILLVGGEVGTEVAVTEGVVVVATEATAEVGLPLLFEVGAEAAPAALEVGAAEALPVAAAEAAPLVAAPTATATVATTSTVGTLGTATIAVASSQLSSDSQQSTASSQNQTASSNQNQTSSNQQPRRRRRRQCSLEPCDEPLPITWPSGFLPIPEYFHGGELIRTSRGERIFEGTDRSRAQRDFSNEIAANKRRGMSPPSPCFPGHADHWDRYHAHHIQPLFLGGEDQYYNLCALPVDMHEEGHPLLKYQWMHAETYRECGICSTNLYDHPVGQEYYIAAEL